MAAALIVAVIGYEERALQKQTPATETTPERNDTWTGLFRWFFRVETPLGRWIFLRTCDFLYDWFPRHVLGDAD